MDISNITNTQAEAGCIATFISHPEFLTHFDYLQPRFFYDEINQCMFWAIQSLVNKDGIDNIDAFNLSNKLYSNTAIKRKTDEYNISSLQEYIDYSKYVARDTLEETQVLVREVVTLAYKREMVVATEQIQKSCFDSEMSLKKLEDIIDSKLNKLTEKYLVNDDLEKFGTKVDEIWEGIVAKRNPDGSFGLPSKFPHVNEYYTYCPGELIVIAGRMKSGKSIFMMNECIDKLRKGIGTVYFDSEMSDELFFLRMLSNVSGVATNKIKNGNYTPEEEQKIYEAKDWISKQNFTHIYMPVVDMDSMYATVKILKIRDNIGFVIYDYIKTYEGDSAAMISAIIGRLTDFLKNKISGELNIAVLAGAQLNRENQISDSDKLSRVASTVAIWKQKEVEQVSKDGLSCGNYCLQVKHNRNGANMDEDEYIDFMFEPNIMRITEAREQHKVEESPFEG